MYKMINKVKKQFLLLVFMSVALCGYAQNSNVVDQIVWVVGDEAILKSDVEKARMDMLSRKMRIEGDPYCLIPEQLAVQKLFLDQAKIDSIEVSSAEINRSVAAHENMIINNIGSKEKVEEYWGTSLNQLREEWRDQIRNEQMISRVRTNLMQKATGLTPSDVRKFYEQLPKDSLPFIPPTVEVQIITIEPTIPLAVSDEIKARLRDYTNRINNGDSFASLAIMYSEDPGSGIKGGEMGFVGRAELVPEFANVAFSLNDPKKVSNVVETEYGYHIIQLVERRGDRINVRHILLQPKVPAEELQKAMTRMDSLALDIRANKFSFEEATVLSADKDTRNNNGLMVNRKESSNYGTPRFLMEELPSEVAMAVDKLKVNDVSAPFSMKLKNGREVVAIVKLKSRIDGHIANVSDDYQVLKELVENKKKEDALITWLQKKIKDTYVEIDSEWRSCDFQYSGWIKDSE